jgi:hypothetical protein
MGQQTSAAEYAATTVLIEVSKRRVVVESAVVAGLGGGAVDVTPFLGHVGSGGGSAMAAAVIAYGGHKFVRKAFGPRLDRINRQRRLAKGKTVS